MARDILCHPPLKCLARNLRRSQRIGNTRDSRKSGQLLVRHAQVERLGTFRLNSKHFDAFATSALEMTMSIESLHDTGKHATTAHTAYQRIEIAIHTHLLFKLIRNCGVSLPDIFVVERWDVNAILILAQQFFSQMSIGFTPMVPYLHHVRS